MPPHKPFLRQFLNPHGWVALVGMAVTAVFFLITRTDAISANRLAAEGVDTVALLTDRHLTTSYSKTGTRHHYHLDYRFLVDGKPVEGSQKVSHGFYTRALIGDMVPIRYWSKDPTLSEVERGTHARQALYGQIATGTAALATLAFAIPGFRRALRASWARRKGIPRAVKVIRLEPVWYSSAKAPRLRLVWREPDGREGRSWPGHPINLPKPGEQTTTLADPSGIKTSFWTGNL